MRMHVAKAWGCIPVTAGAAGLEAQRCHLTAWPAIPPGSPGQQFAHLARDRAVPAAASGAAD